MILGNWGGLKDMSPAAEAMKGQLSKHGPAAVVASCVGLVTIALTFKLLLPLINDADAGDSVSQSQLSSSLVSAKQEVLAITNGKISGLSADIARVERVCEALVLEQKAQSVAQVGVETQLRGLTESLRKSESDKKLDSLILAVSKLLERDPE